MNDTEIDQGLRDYYQSITPADSVRATNLVAASIRARRDRGAARDALARPWIAIGIAAALIVAIVAGAGFAAWRAGWSGVLPGTAGGAASTTPPATTAGAGASQRPGTGPTESPATRPSPTLRPATSSTPSGRFSPTGSMNGRYDTATLLLDGRVLMTGDYTRTTIGDYTVSIFSTSADLYDPATGRFGPTGSMVQAQGGATATRLRDGRVLFAGGVEFSNDGGQLVSTTLATAQTYDPTTGEFSPTGSMGERRQGQTATLLDDGDVLIAGGSNLTGPLATAELYDPRTGAFRPTGDMTVARVQATATLLSDGRVLIIGGMNSTMLTSAEVYDPSTGRFSPTGSIDTFRGDCTVTRLQDGRVLLAGGGLGGTLATAELYDPPSGTWSPTGSMTTGRSGQSATLLLDGKVLIAGGTLAANVGYLGPGRQSALLAARPAFVEDRYDASLPSPVAGVPGMTGPSILLTSAELYDPGTGKFSPTGSLGTARALATATLLLDGRVLVAGGDSSTGTSAELYQP